MRTSLGFSSKNIAQTLSRWGAELRNMFFLGDEDFEPAPWGFDTSRLRSNTAGITFSNLSILRADYLHVGRICWWNIHFSVQPSADCIDIVFPGPPPIPDMFHSGSDAARVPGGCGTIYWVRWPAVLGAYSFRTALMVTYQGAEDLDFVVRPTLTQQALLYTNAGTAPIVTIAQGFYFTKNRPER